LRILSDRLRVAFLQHSLDELSILLKVLGEQLVLVGLRDLQVHAQEDEHLYIAVDRQLFVALQQKLLVGRLHLETR
jgi:hypothetical protein